MIRGLYAQSQQVVDRVVSDIRDSQKRLVETRLPHFAPRPTLTRDTVCLVIAVQSPVQLSYLVAVGENLSFTHCPADSLEGVLLSHVPQVLSERRCLMIEGRARLREVGILYRSALYPLADDGIAIDHLLGAANYRPLRENEKLKKPLMRTKWL